MKCWLPDLPPGTEINDLVPLAHHRWIVKRDDLERKQTLGLGYFEGRP